MVSGHLLLKIFPPLKISSETFGFLAHANYLKALGVLMVFPTIIKILRKEWLYLKKMTSELRKSSYSFYRSTSNCKSLQELLLQTVFLVEHHPYPQSLI